ncbi:hypothetical protein BSKO_03029 [Bryopsis sp. KO-2023]|nr:hypothetical protein BSKO_03029 [Bryopsis sp. KO-2023]
MNGTHFQRRVVGLGLAPVHTKCRLAIVHRPWARQPYGSIPRKNEGFRSGRPSMAALKASSSEVETRTEQFVKDLEEMEGGQDVESMRSSLLALQDEAGGLGKEIDDAYRKMFSGRSVSVEAESGGADDGSKSDEIVQLNDVDEAAFSELGKESPKVLMQILQDISKNQPNEWQEFQARIQQLKLKRNRVDRKIEDMESALASAERESAMKSLILEDEGDVYDESSIKPISGTMNIVMVTGFESFNSGLYMKAAQRVSKRFPNVSISVFDDRAIKGNPEKLGKAIDSADVVFSSLIVDYDDALWLRERIEKVPLRFIFESALELMSMTKIGSFQMASGKKAEAPPIVKKVLGLFGSGREEDRLLGYLSFLKIGPKLLKFIPGDRARDIKNWLTVYSYWNQGGLENVKNMFLYIVDQYLGPTGLPETGVVETPQTGCLHPDYDGYFASPAEYLKWYEANGPVKTRNAPTVGVMVYRKHVITGAEYVRQLITLIEEGGLRPVPIFINGVEAHTIVRDQMTTEHEQKLVKAGKGDNPTLQKDAIMVDAIVNTIGFPLVGGPAGSVEAGRQTDISKAILKTKNVPYIIASPLLVQNLESWMKDGITGLQSVVLYSLPELDGAIDTVPLGGLVGDNIFLIPERVKKMSARLKNWINLRKKPPSERKIAILLYGFPPGVGATGTAALLNVPKSLTYVLKALKKEGYDLGDMPDDFDGEALIEALKAQEGQRTVFKGKDGIHTAGSGSAEQYGVQAAAAEVAPRELKEMLTYPEEWGPWEWGPIPFLPENDILVQRVEKQWGKLERYRGLSTTAKGNYLIGGLQLGNAWIGVQPLLGVEGDPMRLLFERDLTPHPQYAAFYKWLEAEYQADAVLHFGMHGTVEWLPGSPLGNTGFSWSDVLLGNMPNVYVYACNNPSESIIAKRRGYGTIVSHNVPPYGRAGLYKQLSEVRGLVSEYREQPAPEMKTSIVQALDTAGLQEDCPFQPGKNGAPDKTIDPENAGEISDDEFMEYMGRINQYLQVLENRLFSEGLHVLGAPPSQDQLAQYLGAYFGDDIPEEIVEKISSLPQGLPSSSIKSTLGLNGNAETLMPRIEEAIEIRDLLSRNSEEIDAIVQALNGEYLEAAPGGDLLRDGAGVLPTGKNIHALDPYRMPGLAAVARGSKVAEAIIEKHLADNDGVYPETLAVNLWGLDAIKTKGESVAIVLHMVGAKPVQEGTGRIARFELLPLEELGGRPRIDVLCNLSGIFRDSFQNVVELLDDLFQRAADADEDPALNYIRKHALEMKGTGLENSTARLFSNPAGDYGSMVNERVGASDWENSAELGTTWASRNSFSYGRGEKGTARPEVLQALLKTTDRIVQEIDSVEYGLTDIQEYYANTGALKQAAETARDGKRVGASIVETFSKSVKPTELDDVLRMEYRTKLLNPKWAQAMSDQGSGGAYEISTRMTAMVGWGATTGFTDDWAWDQAADTYALDPEMAKKLRDANPQAFKNTVRRMLEAAGRGFWKTDSETITKLQTVYGDIEDELEGV